jgi:transposase InsO family protein
VICAEEKAKRKHTTGTLSSQVLEVSDPFTVWIMDTAGPFYNKRHQKRYLILFVDACSRELRIAVVNSKDASSFAQAFLREIIYKSGVPLRLHSDRGTNFTSEVTQHLCEALDIETSFGLSYHPRGQGAVERLVAEVKTAISTALKHHKLKPNSKTLDLEDAVKIAEAIHNQSPHRSTNISPFQFLYGCNPRLPLNIPLGPSTAEQQDSIANMRDFYRAVHKEMYQSYIKEEIEKYARKAKTSKITAGIQVLRTIHQGLPNQTTTGPHTVITSAGSNSWVISQPNNQPGHNLTAPDIQLTPVLPAPHVREGLPAQEIQLGPVLPN